jgi:hypothetical protein
VTGRTARADSTLDVELRQYLASVAALMDRMHPERRDGRRFTSYEALVLGLGRPFTAGSLPTPRRLRGPYRACYRNTFKLVHARPQLRYTEGYAIATIDDDFTGIPVQHAWAVDDAGRVMDPTWPDAGRSAYFGIEFDLADVSRHIIRTNGAGVLAGDYLLGFPLLRTGRLFPDDASDSQAVRSASIEH